MIIHKSY